MTGGGSNGSVIHYSRNDQKVSASITWSLSFTIKKDGKKIMNIHLYVHERKMIAGQRRGFGLNGYWM